MECPFRVQYYSEKGGAIEENFELSQRVYEILEFLEVQGATLKGEGLTYEVYEDNIIFYVTYEVYMEKSLDIDEYMENLEIGNVGKLTSRI